MTKEFVPYELALKLKEIGFDEQCFGYYLARKLLITNNNDIYNSTALPVIKAPTFSQAFRFFRENYRLSVLIQDWLDDYSGEIVEWTIGEDRIIYEITNRTDTYDEAELACLDKLIELVESELK
jgi:hypothetical protein